LFFIFAVAITHAAKPVAEIVGGPVLSGDEGSEILFQGNGIDPDDKGIKSYHWDFDYNDPDFTIDSTEQNPHYTYLDNGEFKIALRVIDDDDEEGEFDIAIITIANVSPNLANPTISPPNPGEGELVTVLASFTDAGIDDTHTATIDWGDDTTDAGEVVEEKGAGHVAGQHVYVNDGGYTITVTVTDKDGAPASASSIVTVSNIPPVVDAGSDISVTEDNPSVEITASFTDMGIKDTHTATIDWGDGTPIEEGKLTESDGKGKVAGRHLYLADDGNYTVTVAVTDDNGDEAKDTNIVTVLNIKPTIESVTGTGSEGSSAAVEITASDSHADKLFYSFDWDNDGTYEIEDQDNASASYTWDDNGDYTIGVKVIDDDDGQTATTATITIENVPPTVGDITLSPPTPSEGGLVSISVPFTDAGIYDRHTAMIDWGDDTTDAGVVEENGAGHVTGQHVYVNDGSYTIIVIVTDKDGASASATSVVTVSNIPPVVDVHSDKSVTDEDNPSVDIIAHFTDVGIKDIHTATIDWGDGTQTKEGKLPESDGEGMVTGHHLYLADDGNYTVTVTVTDDSGGNAQDILHVTVKNVKPAITAVTNPTGNECDSITVEITASDVPADILSYSFDWGNDGNYDVIDNPDVSANHTWDDNGTYTVGVKVNDEDGGEATATTKITVLNANPTIESVTGTGSEGSSVAIKITALDCPSDTLSYSFDWDNDGTHEITDNTNGSASYTWDDNGDYTIGVKVIDDDDGKTETTAIITIENVPPAVGDITFSPPTPSEGGLVSISVPFTDAGIYDTHTAMIDWGDDTTGVGAVVEEDNADYIAGQHVYANDGSYTIMVIVTDKDGAPASASSVVTVNNIPPVVDAGSNITVYEDNPSVNITASFTDVGIKDTHTATIDWGDGKPTEEGILTESDGEGEVVGRHLYPADDGNYTATVTITDDSGESAQDTLHVTVKNVKPTITAVTNPTGNECDSITVEITASDVRADILNYSFDWDNDDNYDVVDIHNDSANHTWNDSGIYTVGVKINDEDGGEATATTKITVLNANPTIESVTGTGSEGSSVAIEITASDCSSNTLLYSFDWDNDGVYDVTNSTDSSASHTWEDNGNYPVGVRATDDDDGKTETIAAIIIKNVPPSIGDDITISPSESKVFEGELVIVSATFTDVGIKDTHTATIDWGDGSKENIAVTQQQGEGTVLGSHRYANDGKYTVILMITDNNKGSSHPEEHEVTVVNKPPEIRLTVTPSPSNEGDNVRLAVVFSDAGVKDTHTATIDWGDGHQDNNVVPDGKDGLGMISVEHSYDDDGTYTVVVTVADENDSDIYTQELTVHNRPPDIKAIDINPSSPNEGQIARLSITFIDLGINDTHTAKINWGDGSKTDVDDVTKHNGQSYLECQHAYVNDGVYTITIAVTDKDDGEATTTKVVTINNVNPAINKIIPSTGGYEGSSITVKIIAFDDGEDTLTYSFDWNNDNVYDIIDIPSNSAEHIFHDNGSHIVNVKVSDNDSGFDTQNTTVDIQNVAPVIDSVAILMNIYEGDNVTVTTHFTDVGINDTHTAKINWGDGSNPETIINEKQGSGNASGSHQYTDNGEYTVTVTVTDKDGDSDQKEQQVNVYNQPPVIIALTTPSSANEGETVTIKANFTDAGTADTHAAIVDWGDGNIDENIQPEEKYSYSTVSASHKYADNNTYIITVTVTDDDDDNSEFSKQISVSNLPPQIKSIQLPHDSPLQGGTIELTCLFTDAGIADTHTAKIDWGDGNIDVDIKPEENEHNKVKGQHVYPNDGDYTITVTVTDDDGKDTPESKQITVQNQKPQIEPIRIASSPPKEQPNEGDTISITANFTDADTGDTHIATIKWGDGSEEKGIMIEEKGSGSVSSSHQYADDGVYTITLTVTDDGGEQATETFEISVNNAPPNVRVECSQLTVNADDEVTFIGSFTDPGSNDTHTYEWNFGDGTLKQGILQESHKYLEPGLFDVILTITDDDGTEGKSKPLTVTVQQVSKLEIVKLEPAVSKISENNQILTITMEIKNSGRATATQVTPDLTSNIPEVNSRLTGPEATWFDKPDEIPSGKDAKFEWTFVTKVGDADAIHELIFTGVVWYKDGQVSASTSPVIVQRMPDTEINIQAEKDGETADLIGIDQKFNVILNITNNGDTTVEVSPTEYELNLSDYEIIPPDLVKIPGGTSASLYYEVETIEGQTESEYGKRIKIDKQKFSIIEVETGKPLISFTVTSSESIDIDMERPKLKEAEYRDANDDFLINSGDALRLTFDEEIYLGKNISTEDFIITQNPNSSIKGSLGKNISVHSEGRVITIALGDSPHLFLENDVLTDIRITEETRHIVDAAGNSPDGTSVPITFKDRQSPIVVPSNLPFKQIVGKQSTFVVGSRPAFRIWVTDQSDGASSGLDLSEGAIEVKLDKNSIEIHEKAKLKVGEEKLISNQNRKYTPIDIIFNQSLSSGSYTLTVRVKDKQDNRSEIFMDFEVLPSPTEENPIVGLTNYPNPFRSGEGTIFLFDLNGEDRRNFDVTFIIYDTASRPVKRIQEQNISFHPHCKITWDGRAESGAPLAGGVYLCRMTVNYNGNKYRRHAKIAILPEK